MTELEVSETEPSRALARSFAKQLNKHGHGFHYAVLRKAQQLAKSGWSQWIFEVSEFPVSVASGGMHVDFILRHPDRDLLLVAECKRSNPAHSRWCFARAPYLSREATSDSAILETLWYQHPRELLFHTPAVHGTPLRSSEPGYHLAIALTSGKEGDTNGDKRSEVLATATGQIARAVNGLVNTLAVRYPVLPVAPDKRPVVSILPVIFTTAELWTTELALDLTDLASGNIMAEELRLERKGYVAYHYPMSPDLRHDVPDATAPPYQTLGQILEREYMRTIFIVSVEGIEEFLHRDWDPLV